MPRKRESFYFFPVIFALILLLSSCCGLLTQKNSCKLPSRVGFDIDDTMLFSSPCFTMGFESGTEAYSDEFWQIVNSCDCEHSIVKKKTQEIIRDYQKRDTEIYVITARKPAGGENLRECINRLFNIPPQNVYFEPDGKSNRIKELKLDVYYGDSDTDITDAAAANVKAVRILRSPESNYKKKYNPGKFNEEIVQGSEE